MQSVIKGCCSAGAWINVTADGTGPMHPADSSHALPASPLHHFWGSSDSALNVPEYKTKRKIIGIISVKVGGQCLFFHFWDLFSTFLAH